jgi:sigma-B regulation protein RsbU (phosphoserine phosphatase)
MKILIAEDDPILLQFLARMVQSWGHAVLCAADGLEAWHCFERHADVDLVISDWMMPGLDGPELVRRIRNCRRPGYVYLMLLTAKARSADIVQGMEAGADDFLVKPFDQEELRVRLRAGERVVALEHKLARRNAELEAANARMRGDLQAAARVQRSLLPAALPELRAGRFAWAFRPCEELAGDSIGIMPLDERHTALHVLDVSGHGVAAALLSVSVRHVMSPVSSASSLLRQPAAGSSAWHLVPPAEVAAELNRRFPVDADTGRYFTLLYGILDMELRQFRYVSAGHPGPIHVPAGGPPAVLKAAGLPIGLDEKAVFREQVVQLERGDRLYLYSDGVWEAASAAQGPFGPQEFLLALERIRELPLQEGLDRLLAELEQWCGTAQVKDDASLLAFEA